MSNVWNEKSAVRIDETKKKRPGWEGSGPFHHVPINDSQPHLTNPGEKCPCKPEFVRHSRTDKFGETHNWTVARHHWFDKNLERLERENRLHTGVHATASRDKAVEILAQGWLRQKPKSLKDKRIAFGQDQPLN